VHGNLGTRLLLQARRSAGMIAIGVRQEDPLHVLR